MTQPMNIRPDVAYREQVVQMQFLKDRILILAQTLADVASERDQALSEREALSKELADLKAAQSEGGDDGASE